MTDGLITRIGKWIDYKWASKATWLDVQAQEQRCSERHIGALGLIAETKVYLDSALAEIKKETVVTPKDFADLKERLGHLEVYVGMARKVDPTKPPMAKSAFAM